MDKKEQELQEISVAKTVTMLCVVADHACIMFLNNGWGGWTARHRSYGLGLVSQYLGLFIVQCFAFCAGYLFYMGRYEQGKYRRFRQDVGRRAQRLMIPYGITAVCWAIPAACLIRGFSLQRIFRNFVLAESPAQLWFLVVLFLLFLLFYFVADVAVGVPKWAGITGFYLLYLLSAAFYISLFQIGRTLQYALYFYLGMLCRRGIKLLDKMPRYVPLTAYIVGGAGYLWLRSQPQRVLYVAAVLIEPWVSVAGIFQMVLLCRRLCAWGLTERPIYQTLSRYSMGVYLLHQQLIYITMRLLDPLALSSLAVAGLNFCLSLGVSLGLSALAAQTRLGRLWLGEGCRKSENVTKF
jgi:uncharacterized membrane protein YhaH (DUF805 family)